MKFLSLLKRRSSSSSWGFPYCHPPQTLSFRANQNDVLFKTMNSAYIDSPTTATTITSVTATTNTPSTEIQESTESVFTESPNSPSIIAATTTNTTNTEIQEITDSVFTESPLSASFSSISDNDSRGGADQIDILIRGLRDLDRLFVEPEKSSSIFEAKIGASESFASSPFRDSLVQPVDSGDPYWDFRNSMEEMAEAHGVNTWEDLEELLYLFLRLNEKTNHEYIVDAYVDFLKDLAVDSNDPCPSPASCGGDQKEVHARAPSFSPWLFEQVKKEIGPEDEASSSSYSNT
ncbi:transcription repressor OFP13-like [Lotus japonicus]|uniref:transcription repressor OFP13-like n=1 Tax=Lotus japonicus TaxID=34305 RepID=UPI002588F122|nr:transcription repressor OFP13-like [Lotus japonicus]